MPKLILASKSPRRRGRCSIVWGLTIPPSVWMLIEHFPDGLSPEDVVKHISREKAFAAALMVTAEDIVITADTMVFLDDKKLGKPASEEDAFPRPALSGRAHTVCTGVTVMQGSKLLTEAESTRVYFAPLSEETIRAYIRTGEPMDKAGSYGIQGMGALLVEKIDGDFFNVMGLPMRRLSTMLKPFGVDVLS